MDIFHYFHCQTQNIKTVVCWNY